MTRKVCTLVEELGHAKEDEKGGWNSHLEWCKLALATLDERTNVMAVGVNIIVATDQHIVADDHLNHSSFIIRTIVYEV